MISKESRMSTLLAIMLTAAHVWRLQGATGILLMSYLSHGLLMVEARCHAASTKRKVSLTLNTEPGQ